MLISNEHASVSLQHSHRIIAWKWLHLCETVCRCTNLFKTQICGWFRRFEAMLCQAEASCGHLDETRSNNNPVNKGKINDHSQYEVYIGYPPLCDYPYYYFITAQWCLSHCPPPVLLGVFTCYIWFLFCLLLKGSNFLRASFSIWFSFLPHSDSSAAAFVILAPIKVCRQPKYASFKCSCGMLN